MEGASGSPFRLTCDGSGARGPAIVGFALMAQAPAVRAAGSGWEEPGNFV